MYNTKKGRMNLRSFLWFDSTMVAIFLRKLSSTGRRLAKEKARLFLLSRLLRWCGYGEKISRATLPKKQKLRASSHFRFFGAGMESRTPISSLGRIHNSRYTIPATSLLYHTNSNFRDFHSRWFRRA